ncbi:MAG TPA: MBL fold metallo-hydrolase [Rhodothermales bacterium]|nr:MBL fold metallo-hydrolase [Rhodothermales bacterium]
MTASIPIWRDRMQYGLLEVFHLNEGKFNVGADKRLVPHIEGQPFPPRTLHVAANAFVVRTPNEVVLFDTGLGEEAEGRNISFLTDQLAHLGVSREEVSKVFLSHFHADHIGGATYQVGFERRPTFPNATYFAQQREAKTPYAGRSNDLRAITIDVLEEHGQLVWLDGNGWIEDLIEYEVTGGHTPFHQIAWLHFDGLVVLFGGDVLPQPTQVTRRFLAKYDYQPEQSAEWRQKMARRAYENGAMMLFYHSTSYPAAFLPAFNEKIGYKLEPVSL